VATFDANSHPPCSAHAFSDCRHLIFFTGGKRRRAFILPPVPLKRWDADKPPEKGVFLAKNAAWII